MSLRDKLREALAGQKATVNYGPNGEMYANLPKVSFEVDPSDTAVDIKLKIEARQMSITGAGQLAGSIRDRIEQAKKKIAEVGERTDQALNRLNEAADRGEKIASKIETEAADLDSQLGQFSNE